MLAYAYDARPFRGRGRPTSTQVVWTEVDGAQVGTFELKDVAIDAHSIGFYRSESVYDATPMGDLLAETRYTVPRGETLHLHLNDQRVQVTVTVTARDAISKKLIEAFQVMGAREEDTARGLAAQDVYADGYQGVAQLESLTAPEAYGLFIEANGYQFKMLKPGALKDRKDLTVELTPDWSAMLGALTDSGEVLEGVEFFVDGVSAGKQLGAAESKGIWSEEYLYGSMPILRMEAPPKRIEARKEGWVLAQDGPTDDQWRLSSSSATHGGQLIWLMKEAPSK